MTIQEAILHLRARAAENRAHEPRVRRRWNMSDIAAVETVLAWLAEAQRDRATRRD